MRRIVGFVICCLLVVAPGGGRAASLVRKKNDTGKRKVLRTWMGRVQTTRPVQWLKHPVDKRLVQRAHALADTLSRLTRADLEQLRRTAAALATRQGKKQLAAALRRIPKEELLPILRELATDVRARALGMYRMVKAHPEYFALLIGLSLVSAEVKSALASTELFDFLGLPNSEQIFAESRGFHDGTNLEHLPKDLDKISTPYDYFSDDNFYYDYREGYRDAPHVFEHMKDLNGREFEEVARETPPSELRQLVKDTLGLDKLTEGYIQGVEHGVDSYQAGKGYLPESAYTPLPHSTEELGETLKERYLRGLVDGYEQAHGYGDFGNGDFHDKHRHLGDFGNGDFHDKHRDLDEGESRHYREDHGYDGYGEKRSHKYD